MSKRVLCTDCGFLCWDISIVNGDSTGETGTVDKESRREFQEGKSDGRNGIWEPYQTSCDLGCFRRLWSWSYNQEPITPENVDAQELKKPRDCAFFTHFRPGFSPKEHKDLALKIEARAATRNVALLSALIGGVVSTIGNILYNIFTK